MNLERFNKACEIQEQINIVEHQIAEIKKYALSDVEETGDKLSGIVVVNSITLTSNKGHTIINLSDDFARSLTWQIISALQAKLKNRKTEFQKI